MRNEISGSRLNQIGAFSLNDLIITIILRQDLVERLDLIMRSKIIEQTLIFL